MTPDGYTNIGSVVRRRRRQLGLEQAEVAALAGVSRKFLSEMERGKQTVQLDRVVAVLSALGLELTVAPSGGPGPP